MTDGSAQRPPSTFELQSAVAAAARSSGHPVLDAGRGQPNWLATEPRAAFFTLGQFAVGEAERASGDAHWGRPPPADGIADRLLEAADDGSAGGTLLAEAIAYCQQEFDHRPDALVHELVHGVLGAGYPSPPRVLRHVERILQRYLLTVIGSPFAPAGTYKVFATEGGAAAMSYLFRTLRENELVAPGDKIAIATPIFTPYLQIPVLEDFGLDVVELASDPHHPDRFGEDPFEQLRDPAIKAFFIVNPGNPDSRALPAARLAQLHTLVTVDRPDLIIVADTVYATFVDGFHGTMTELPRNVIVLHSFSKNFGATGSRLGFIAVHHDNVVDDLLRRQDAPTRAAQSVRYGSMTSDVATLSFVDRLVADSREVALHNIAGLATPDQVQMALFALAYLLPRGRTYFEAVRAELRTRIEALIEPLGVPMVGGRDSFYYALVDVLAVTAARRGAEVATRVAEQVDPQEVATALARDHGVIVQPGYLFGCAGWDARVSLASLDADELRQVGAAIVAVVDGL